MSIRVVDGELRRQVVVAHGDGSHTVQTLALRDGCWIVTREAVANARSIAQATLNGAIINADD